MPTEPAREPERLRSPLLSVAGFSHGFFTRRGGVSGPPWDSLNLAANTGDLPAHVAENRSRVVSVLGLDPSGLHMPSQVHGVAVLEVGTPTSRDASAHVEADATLALEPGIGCAVRSADCGTVLIGDRRSGAALAIHAGWKGTVLGVVPVAVERLVARIGAVDGLVAAIGPHLEACCFEVGEDVAAQLASASPLGERAVSLSRPKPHVDLRAIVEAQLVALGIERTAIDHVRGCTRCDAERFFSYRRDGARSGRLVSAIVSRGSTSEHVRDRGEARRDLEP
jgi:hypothetical protein